MSDQLIDLTPDFLAFWDAAQGRSPAKQQRLWYERYEFPHQKLFAQCGGRHGNAAALPAALARYPSLVPHLPATVAEVRAAIARTGPAVAALFGLERLDLRSVLLVGMFWSDGWIAEVEGVPTCFIAVEYLTPAAEPRVGLLLAHETAHIAHAMCLGAAWDELETVGQHLFLEGLATVASAHLVPGYDPATYAWLGLAHTPRGLTLDEWTAACTAAWPRVKSLLRQDVAAVDPAVFAPYFLQAPADLPERIGYFAGWQLVAAFAQEHAVAELARWPPQRIQERVAQALADHTY
jgi:hypothetical protein